MKQLLSLFLILLPCLALAQYPSNGNQKITLGEQTTADGLIYRGVAADTTTTVKSDTAAYFVLDTVNKKLYFYKVSATPKWNEISGSGGGGVTTFSAGTTGLTPNTATSGAVTLGGTLAVANGGTGASVKIFVDTINTQTVNGAKTFSSTVTGARFDPTSSSASGNGMYLPTTNSLGFSIANTEAMRLNANKKLLIGNTTNAQSTDLGIADLQLENINFGTLQMIGYKNSVDGGYVGMYKARGESFVTVDRTNILDGDFPGQFFFGGWRDGAWRTGAILTVIYNTGYSEMANSFQFRLKNASNNFLTRMMIRYDGNVGIGTTTPAVQFHTTSNVRFAGLVNYDPVETDADGDIIDGGASDFNLKNSIEPINYGLNCINQLKPVSYLWNDVNRKLDSTIPDIGFIAQDVMDVIPEAVRSNGDGDLQLNYKAITATLVKAIQEQNLLIKALEQRIINLENK